MNGTASENDFADADVYFLQEIYKTNIEAQPLPKIFKSKHHKEFFPNGTRGGHSLAVSPRNYAIKEISLVDSFMHAIPYKFNLPKSAPATADLPREFVAFNI